MNKTLKIKTPAKINLSLEIIDKLPNGYHSLSSIMQTVSLYDFLTFELSEKSGENEIILNGNNPNIPYNEKNIVWKVLNLYFEKINAKGIKVEIDIEKNIPTQAGLAGGSTNGAGALIAINALMNNELSTEEIHKIASIVGSDLNFCLAGGACLLSSRGEIIEEKLPYQKFDVAIVKPKNIAISTPQCYKDFSQKYFEKKNPIYSTKIVELFKNDFSIEKLAQYLYNDLETPAIDNFPEINDIKQNLINFGCKNSLMSGSGSSVFGLHKNNITIPNKDDWEIFYTQSTDHGAILL